MPRTTVKMICAHCGSIFYRPPSRIQNGRGKHCSRSCQYAAARAAPKSGMDFTCQNCGSRKHLPPSKMVKPGAGKYCSRFCRDEHWRGSASPHWQGGSGVYKRGSRWQAIKRAARLRDNQKCQHCGARDSLHVHHIIPFRMFDDDNSANDMDNLITLCAPCHRVEDSKWKWLKTEDGIHKFRSGSVEWEDAKKKFLA